MKLSKALKLKNALTGELNKYQEILARENSRRDDSSSKVNRSEIWLKIHVITDKLIRLKGLISKANVPIYEKIAQMAELKNRINFINQLNTKDGDFLESVGHQTEPTKVHYDAYLKKEQIDVEVLRLQEMIQKIQDEVDDFNATTQIDFV
jgi:hypothetical protein